MMKEHLPKIDAYNAIPNNVWNIMGDTSSHDTDSVEIATPSMQRLLKGARY